MYELTSNYIWRPGGKSEVSAEKGTWKPKFHKKWNFKRPQSSMRGDPSPAGSV